MEAITLYKLMVLYMLRNVNYALSNSQLSDFFLNKQYTDYFTLQLVINELLSASLIRVETMRNVSRYELTAEGENVLNYFGDRVSGEIRLDIDEYLKANNFRLRNENCILSDYNKKPQSSDYEVSCMVREGKNNLFELKITAPTEELAERMCANWEKKSNEIYEFIMQKLL